MTVVNEKREASSWVKFRLLMWKNFLIQWRHPKQTVAELAVPVLAMSLILILRSQIEPTLKDATIYPAFPAHTLNYSTSLLIGMDLQKLSIAYSPESPVLDDVVRSSVSTMLARNSLDLLPVLLQLFPQLQDVDIPLDWPPLLELLKTLIRVEAYNNTAAIENIYAQESVTREIIAAVEFPDSLYGATELPANLTYSLRFPEKPRLNTFFSQGGRSWRTTNLFPSFPFPGPRSANSIFGGTDPGYVPEMFIALQHSISTEIVSRLSGIDLRSLSVSLQRYPYPPHIQDMAIQALQYLFPMFVLLSFTYTAVNIVRAVTLEKEMQLKELMKIMGLPTWLHWTAWFCKQFIFMSIITVFFMILLKVNFFETEEGITDYAVVTYTPWTVLFFFLIIYSICIIILSFMVSSFFSKASTAAIFMGVFWFMLYLPAVLLAMDESVSLSAQVVSCLSVNTAMAYGFIIMLGAESTGGLQWSHFFSSPSSDGSQLLFGHVVVLMVVDCILYMLVTLYLEQVLPGPYGTPKPWYFLFQRSFWCQSNQIEDDVVNIFGKDDASPEIVMEDDPKNHAVGVRISNLCKVYAANIAVNNLTLNIYNDQMTVLLGHNGAGKSTTISMLTGNIAPSYGQIWAAGYDVRKQLHRARAHMGLCLQHNVLFTELTTREHLHFFARLKGLKGTELNQETNSLIDKLELRDKYNYQAGGLSGGQKRRLCVGIALCGGAKVVLLDEPTSGMDPSSRRALWDLLQKEKKDRAIILTTHFMDEADYLGDRIAIMASGRLQCVGSPYFLKRHYGIGYTLVLVKDTNFNADKCTECIGRYIPGIQLKDNRGSEVTYNLSNEYSHTFGNLLSELENNKGAIGFKNYGLTSTTMEDVFMTVGSDVPHDLAETTTNDSFNESTIDSVSTDIMRENSKRVSGLKLFWQQIYATWMKLWLVWKGSPGLLALQIIVPTILMVATILISQYMITLIDAVGSRELALNDNFVYTQTYLNYNASSAFASSLAQGYSALFGDQNTLVAIDSGLSAGEYYYQQSLNQTMMDKMRFEVLIGASIEDSAVTAWFSNFGYHDIAISLGTLHSALMKALVPNGELTVYNHPLKTTYENNEDTNVLITVLSAQLSNGISASLGIVTSVFVMFYIKERVSRAKLLQKAAGVQPALLWGGAAIFDWALFIIISCIFIIILAAMQVTGLSSGAELGRLFLLFMVYGAAFLPFTYLCSYFFNGPAFGFVVLVFVNLLLAQLAPQIVQALQTLDVEEIIPTALDYVLQLYPLYSLIVSIRMVHEISLTEWSCMQGCDLLLNTLPNVTECSMDLLCRQNVTICCMRQDAHFDWEEPGVLRYIVSMLATAAACWLLLMLIEYRVHSKIFSRSSAPPPDSQTQQDEDVRDEAAHVLRVPDRALPRHNLLARRLTKYYGKQLAVNQVSFSVSDSECFGLLGVNGAGKTTTFKMLMGDELVSSGDAFVRGHSVRKNIKKVHENIGYCPQFDAVFNEMTGRETLKLFALLRGLKSEHITSMTAYLADSLGFTKHLDKKVHQYSGGNKRKLSAAVALMGNARVIFLDEPTTGVDPAAKRQVWRAIRTAARTRGVILTSHSMEECEALCTRLTIMVNGQFQCLGTPQHLKNKFSQGFTLTVKLKSENEHGSLAVKQYIESNFDNPQLMEEYEGLLTYYLREVDKPWSQLFGIMEKCKQEQQVEDYHISQTTLEQIFLQFTKYQKEAS